MVIQIARITLISAVLVGAPRAGLKRLGLPSFTAHLTVGLNPAPFMASSTLSSSWIVSAAAERLPLCWASSSR
ncbi:hypothetical protein D3C75_1138070 [compost metagenome]